ncbi:MAG: DNA-binding domain-containing protein, partial [Mariniphaga sp.]
ASYKHQSSLANYCRTGEYMPIPGVKEKNVGRYRQLIFNVVNGSLQSAYPLTYNLLDENEWHELAHIFFSSHRCQSPMVWQMPKELYEFAVETNYVLIKKYPFLLDLLLFEWKEVEVYMMEDIEPPPFTSEKLFGAGYVLNPEITVLSLEYPVHLKNAKDITEAEKDNYFVSLHREPETGRVLFTNMQYPHVQVIEKLAQEPVNFDQLLKIFLQYAPEIQARQALHDFVHASLSSKLILGKAIKYSAGVN